MVRKRSKYKPGEMFGLWTIIKFSHKHRNPNFGNVYWCQCKCGTLRQVLGYNLLSGKSTACGCNRKKRKRKGNHKSERDRQLREKYNITEKDYNKLFKKQKGCCAICERHQSEFDRALCVDHNHSTDEVRSLLCFWCNFKVGIVETQDLKVIKDYIKKWDK